MKTKWTKRLLSGFLSLMMLVCLIPTSAMAVETGEPITIEYRTMNLSFRELQDKSFLETCGVFDGPGAVTPGGTLHLSMPPVTSYDDLEPEFIDNWWDNNYSFAYLEVTARDSDSTRILRQRIGYEGTAYTNMVDKTIPNGQNAVDVTIPVDAASVQVTYRWNPLAGSSSPPDVGRPALVTNMINSLDREVQQNGTSIDAKTQYGMDIYKVANKDELTLTYDADMDMTKLGSTFFGDDSWDVLQANKEKISDATYVDLHFEFASDINVAEDLDLTGADLTSDMFTELIGDDGDWWTIKPDTNELILHCRWDSELAAKDNLNPMIELTGVKVNLPSDWDGDTLVIRNHGYVDGKVYIQENGNPKANYCDIDGGEKDDEFILTTSDKVSLPDLEKKILEGGEEKDNTSVNAGDTVTFQLTSNVPENLKDYIHYTQIGTGDPTDNNGEVEVKGEMEKYTLTFHDKMAEELVTPANFEVKLVKNGEETVLPNDPTNGFYALSQPGEDGCTFDINLALDALYNAGIIDESDFGVTSIVVTYEATLDKSVTNGTFENEAWVATDHNWETSHDIVTVDTYQIKILKFDQADPNQTFLPNAHFELYQLVDGEKVLVEDCEDLVTGEDGRVSIDGIKDGIYYLKETKAPEGYVCSDEPLEIVVSDSADDKNIIEVNFANSLIPHTGGMGTTIFSIVGGVLIAMAGTIFVISRRKRRA